MMEALRNGENVVVGSSSATSAAIAETIEDRIADVWRLVGPITAAGSLPIDELYNTFDLHGEHGSRRNAASLLARIESKCVILVDGVGNAQWTEWQRFLDDYANASRAISAVERTQILVVTSGVPKSKLSSRAPALSTLIWDGVISEADVFSYVTQSSLRRGTKIDAQAKLISRIITRLALWDFDLIDSLLDLNPRDLFDPSAAVLAATVGNPSLQQLGTTWEGGGRAEFDGEDLQHAVLLARTGDPKGDLQMRLWAAQASELLPTLEINRRQLTVRMKQARLSLPVKLNDELIHDLSNIEIGPLLYLARKHRLPSDIIRIAEKYTNIRNKLAHLNPVNADEALDIEVLYSRRPR
jgi:hypothetical protein